MAAADWLIDELILSLKRRGNIPTSSESWAAADFRAFANDSMRSYIVPFLRRLSEEFLVTVFDQTVVVGTASYRISYRALGEALRDVQFSDGAGGYVSLVRREPQDSSSYLAQAGGWPPQFYLQDDKVVLLPTPPGSTDVLRIKSLVRPNKLVATANCFKVTAVGATTLTVTPLDSTTSATAQTTLGASPTIDLIKGQPGFRHLAIDLAATISGNTVTCTTTGVSVGDYVCTAEESPVPQIPAELHPLLAQDIACGWMRAANSNGYQEAMAERDRLEAIALGLFAPRTENQPRYVTNHYGVGQRSNWGRFRRGW